MAKKAGTEQGKATGKTSASAKRAAKPKAGSAAAQQQVIFSLQAGTPIYVKTADICTAFGKTNQWVGQLTSQGTIHKTKTSHGMLYNLFETVKAYCQYLEERAKKVSEDEAEINLKRKVAEAKLKESKAVVAELQAKEFQGKMHRSEDVQAMTADLLYFVRGSLLALPGRCATDAAACGDPNEVQKILEKEVFAILDDLSNYGYSKKKYDERVRQRMKRDSADVEEIEDSTEG